MKSRLSVDRQLLESILLHGFYPFVDRRAELLHALLLGIHSGGLPAVSWFEPPVSHSTLSFLLWLPYDLYWHAKFWIPWVYVSQFIGDGCIATVNNDICEYERQAL